MKIEDIPKVENWQDLEARKTVLWDTIVERFDDSTEEVAEICEIEHELTTRETG